MHSELSTFISHQDFSSVRVIDDAIPINKYTKIDLSITNKSLQEINVSSSKKLELYINKAVKVNNADVGFGGYLETRGIYHRSDYFNQQTDPEDERNIHLGIDIWIKAGTNVLAAFKGKVHSFQNNTNFGDYGPTIILEHNLSGFTFYSLYGHLSLESIQHLKVGESITEGQVIAQLGTSEVNGDYPPHLHFQIILNMEDNFGDYPGVCSLNQLVFYKENCPDPLTFLGLK